MHDTEYCLNKPVTIWRNIPKLSFYAVIILWFLSSLRLVFSQNKMCFYFEKKKKETNPATESDSKKLGESNIAMPPSPHIVIVI